VLGPLHIHVQVQVHRTVSPIASLGKKHSYRDNYS
jgi:hypothetical protein